MGVIFSLHYGDDHSPWRLGAMAVLLLAREGGEQTPQCAHGVGDFNLPCYCQTTQTDYTQPSDLA